MKKKFVSTLLASLVLIGLLPISASAEWKQNSDSSWSWINTYGWETYSSWKHIGDNWYYFDYIGKMKTGWLKDGGYWYYLGPSGAMKTGWFNDGGKEYYLNTSGIMACNTTVEGFYLDENGVKQPKESQKVLINDDNVKITYMGINKSSYSPKVVIEIENKSDEDIVVKTKDVSIDGYMVNATLDETVVSKKKVMGEIIFWGSDLSKNLKSIEGKFRILSKLKNAYSYEELEEEDFSIDIK